MPKIGVFQTTRHPAGEPVTLRADIHVSASGMFYANIGDKYGDAACSICEPVPVKNKPLIKICAETKAGLEDMLNSILDAYATPEVESYPVIRYNIESHIAFCETPAGEIVPNGHHDKEAQWAEDDRYGNHNACDKARGGYSLVIGACAELKTITRFGDYETVKYTSYYKGGSHLGTDNPAQRLNSWTSFSLPKRCQEMPYSDEAAEFFYDMMMGMARLSKTIQEKTGTPENLQKLIGSGIGLLEVNA